MLILFMESSENHDNKEEISRIHSRVRRSAQPLDEVIHAYQESLTPLMVFTVIIFILVALVLPLLFTSEYVFYPKDKNRRKVSPEDEEEQDEVISEPDLIRSATQSTQLALEEDDDIMKDVLPTDLQFIIIAHPKRFSLPYENELQGVYEMAKPWLVIHQKPSRQPIFQPPIRRSDPLNPAVVRVPTQLRLPPTKDPKNLEKSSQAQDKGRSFGVNVSPHDNLQEDEEDDKFKRLFDRSHPQVQPHPLVIARRNQPQPALTYNEYDVIVKQRPKQKIPVKSVESQTMSNKKPVAPTAPEVLETSLKQPEENLQERTFKDSDLNDQQQQQQPGPSKNIKKTEKKKHEGKLVVGNSSRFKSRCPDQKKKEKRKSNKDLKHACVCPYPPGVSDVVKTKFRDLTWLQMISYAQAEGTWFNDEETARTPEERQPAEENTEKSAKTKKEDKKDEKNCQEKDKK